MKTSDENIDFICAGAQRSGTTWLYKRLNELPEFSLPLKKELHYFDRSRKYPSPNHLFIKNLYRRLLNLNWTRKAIHDLFSSLISGDYVEFRWLTKWYFGTYNDKWYLSLFDSLEGIKGDITPDYSILSKVDVSKIHSLAPEAKIIFLFRNPIERAWSHYRFNKFVLKHPDLQSPELDIQEIIYFINKEGQELRSNYLRTLENYIEFYPGNQILISFFDVLERDPQNLLTNIVSFVGGDPNSIPKYCNLDTTNNVSPPKAMPKEIEDYLKEKYYSQIKILSETYGSYFTKWYDNLYDDKKSEKMREMFKPTFTLSKVD